MSYNLKISLSFKKDFEKLNSQTQSRVLVELEKLQNNPLANTKKLKKKGIGMFRKRISEYRLRYDIVKKETWLYRIRHREDVYR